MSENKRELPLLNLAWRNARRNIRRTFLTATAILVAVGAVIFMLSYIGGLVNNMLDIYYRTESGHVRIRHEGYAERERSLPLHLYVDQVDEIITTVEQQPDVERALPRIRTMVLVEDAESNKPGMLFGVDIEREEGYLSPSAMLVSGRLPRAGEAEVMVGTLFAEELNVTVGDSLTLIGQTSYRSIGGMRAVITGVGETGLGYLDEKLILAPIDQVQLMTYLTGAATELLVFAKDPDRADSLAAHLASVATSATGAQLEVVSWRDQGPLIQLIESIKPIYGFILFILMLMVSLVIINTMLMTVMERTHEFGMLSALGMRHGDIITLIIVEGLVIGLLGAVIGGAVGSGFAIWLEQTGMDFSQAARDIELPLQGVIYPDWKIGYTILGMLLGVMVAGLASFIPAMRTRRLSPAQALRS